MTILITGGAGFVGAHLAVELAARRPGQEIIALDNLYRRGSELNLPRLRAAGVRFVHGDVRDLDDLLAVGAVDALIECSAEPSVMAGVEGSPNVLVKTNLVGAYHCLEFARRCGAQFVFLSTSRVYPVAPLAALQLHEEETRFEIAADQDVPGAGPNGIDESFPLEGVRTLYGATKLAAELLIIEYAETYGLNTAIDRCGVIAGPWQMGKADQGVFTYWMLAHVLDRPLRYLGFRGSGKQVRDLLHIADLVELIDEQLTDPEAWAGRTVNVGGGRQVSLSLLETTALCAEISGCTIAVEHSSEQRRGDVPAYISDCSRLASMTSWRPRRSARDVLLDTFDWIIANEDVVRRTL